MPQTWVLLPASVTMYHLTSSSKKHLRVLSPMRFMAFTPKLLGKTRKAKITFTWKRKVHHNGYRYVRKILKGLVFDVGIRENRNPKQDMVCYVQRTASSQALATAMYNNFTQNGTRHFSGQEVQGKRQISYKCWRKWLANLEQADLSEYTKI